LSKKERNIIFIIYFIILLIESIYILNGNYLYHFWEFSPNKAILYIDNRTLSPNELNLLYAGFCLSLYLSIIYCITQIINKFKIHLLIINTIFIVLLYLIPYIVTIIVTFPIMIILYIMNLINIQLNNNFFTISLLTIFTILIDSFIMKKFKSILSKLLISN